MKFKYIILAFLLLTCNSLILSGQNFVRITTDNNLSSNNVTSITQDSVGLIWIGTKKGLNSYNAYKVTSYLHSSEDTTSITDDMINKVFVTRNNEVLIATHNGLGLYNTNHDNFTSYFIEKPENAMNMANYFNDIEQDKQGNIWVATAVGLFRFDLKLGVFIPHFTYELLYGINETKKGELLSAGISQEIILKLLTINNTFFQNTDELSKKILQLLGEIDYNLYSQIIIDIVAASNEPFYTSSISSIEIDANGEIWLGFSNGHLVKTYSNSNKYEIAYIEEGIDLESNIFSLFIDEDKVLCGAISGTIVFDKASWSVVKNLGTDFQFVLNKRGISFCDGFSGNLWIGSEQGLHLFNRETKTTKNFRNNYNNPKSISSDLVSDIFIDKQSNLWVATEDAGVNKLNAIKQFEEFNKQSISSEKNVDNRTTSIYVEDQQNIWTGHYSGGIDIFKSNGEIIRSYDAGIKKTDGLGSGTIMTIKPDRNGIIWVGSYLGGVQVYDRKSKTFKNFQLPNTLPGEIHTYQVLCNSSNELWICTLGKGFFKVSSDRKNIHHYTTSDTLYKPSLQNNWVELLFLDNRDQLFFYSTQQLFEIDEENKAIHPVFTHEFNHENRVTTLFEDSRSNFYIGTTSGLFLAKVNGQPTSEYKNKPFFGHRTIVGILEDDHGNLWISTDKGLFRANIDPEQYLKTGTFSYDEYLTGDGLISNYFMLKSKYKSANGKMYFGTDKGVVGFYPDSIKKNAKVPNVILTEFKLFNTVVTPGSSEFLTEHISQAKEIVLPHNQNFISFSFAALNFVNSNANQYAYMLEGVDENWNYVGNRREANYTKLSHGTYQFKVKASNNDGVWNEEGTSIDLIIEPPFWKTGFAMILYALVIIGLLIVFSLLVRYQEKNKAEMNLERFNIEKDNELNKMKLQFFTNISHEFRTPLTLIIGPLESLIQEGVGNIKQLQLIQRNTKKLLNLIDQIMDIRKLSSGKMKLKREELEIISFINDVVSNFEYQCQSKQIELVFNKEVEKLETFVDSNKFETIISNLLSNAVKHTPKGGNVTVNITNYSGNSFELPANAQGIVSISVEDTGQGIPETEIDNVFERFYQSSDKSDGGSGVGLTLVKELTEMHGGKVVLKSKFGRGSVFTVYIPLVNNKTEHIEIANANIIADKANNETENIEVNKDNYSDNTHAVETDDNQFVELDAALPLILVVEDNDEVRNYIISELTDNYRVIDAVNGKEALSLAFEKYPDIIISDIMMPEMDGLELCKRLKSDEKTSHIPIILLTAYNNENTNVAGYETGAESFLAKPFSPKILKTRINNILQNRERIKEKFSNILYSVPSNKSISTIDEQFLYKAIKLVEENLVEEHFSIEYLCKEMGYSRTALYSKIKALTDQSISEFIKLIRLKKSIELFRDGQKSINEVAFLVGFKTHSHFSRCFNDEFDMSPKEYLEKINTENKA